MRRNGVKGELEKGKGKGEHDTGNIDDQFKNMPAAVTMTPAGARQLTEAAEKEGKDFADFTFQGVNVLDGKRYSMSAADLEAELDFPTGDASGSDGEYDD